MNDTERNATGTRTIFSVFRYPRLDSPVDPMRRCYYYERTLERAAPSGAAFVSPLKIISIFVGRRGASRFLSLFSPPPLLVLSLSLFRDAQQSLLLLANVSEVLFSLPAYMRGARTCPVLTRVIEVRSRKFEHDHVHKGNGTPSLYFSPPLVAVFKFCADFDFAVLSVKILNYSTRSDSCNNNRSLNRYAFCIDMIFKLL